LELKIPFLYAPVTNISEEDHSIFTRLFPSPGQIDAWIKYVVHGHIDISELQQGSYPKLSKNIYARVAQLVFAVSDYIFYRILPGCPI